MKLLNKATKKIILFATIFTFSSNFIFYNNTYADCSQYADGPNSKCEQASGGMSQGEMNTEALTSMGFQMAGGIPIGGSTKYSFSSSEGMKNAFAVCYTSNPDPELYSNVEVTCVAYSRNGGMFIPPLQKATLDTSKSGTTSVSLNFVGMKKVPDGTGFRMEPIRLNAKVTASVYEGTNSLGGDQLSYGFNYGMTDDYSNNQNNSSTSFDSNYSDGLSWNSSDAKYDPTNAEYNANAGYNNSNSGYDTNNAGYKTDIVPDSTLNDVLHSYGDASTEFNAGEADWASSSADGGESDLDSYFNSGLADMFDVGNNSDGLTTDLGLSDFYGLDNSNNGLSMEDFSDMLNSGLLSEEDLSNMLNSGALTKEDLQTMQDVLNSNGINSDNLNADTDVLGGTGNYYGLDSTSGGYYDNDGIFHSTGSTLEQENMFDSALDILNNIGNDVSTGNSGNMMDSLLKDVFGKEDTIISQFSPDTMTDQELFDLAKRLLSEAGFSLEDILKGKNYDSGSAYTDEKEAWDMNRITTLIKNKKIKLPDDELTKMNKLRAEKKSALSKAINETKAPKIQVQ